MIPLHILKQLWNLRKAVPKGGLATGGIAAGLGLFGLNQVGDRVDEHAQNVININAEYGYPDRQEALTPEDFPSPEDYDKYMIKLHNNRIMY